MSLLLAAMHANPKINKDDLRVTFSTVTQSFRVTDTVDTFSHKTAASETSGERQ